MCIIFINLFLLLNKSKNKIFTQIILFTFIFNRKIFPDPHISNYNVIYRFYGRNKKKKIILHKKLCEMSKFIKIIFNFHHK
jgi:hypothetical protein